MTVKTAYCSTDELRAFIGNSASTANADLLEIAREAASRAVDNVCGRRFYLDDAATARSYAAPYGICRFEALYVDDFDPGTVPIVKFDSAGDGTFSTTWVASTDYRFEPLNQVGEPRPQRLLRFLSYGVYPTLYGRPQIQVTAKWGWPAVPIAVKQVTLAVAEDLYKSKDAAFGVAGIADLGVLRIKESVRLGWMLDPYKLPSGIA